MIGSGTFVGVNAFFDNSRLFGDWFSAWGWGLEMAAVGPGSGLLDLHFNQYGTQFGRLRTVIDLWRRGGSKLRCGGGLFWHGPSW